MTAARRRPGGSRLLGRYPVSALHLVGTDPPPDPRAPGNWRPGPPPLQHGLDYTFARRYGLTPVRWRPGTVIVVRLVGQSGSMSAVEGSEQAVDTVVAELRELTGLELLGEPSLAGPIDIRRVPDQEIHVTYLPSAQAREMRRLVGDGTLNGGAVSAGDGAWYRCGWVIVDTDLASSPADQPSGGSHSAAWTATGLAALRHQFGHALGLGHPASRRALMYQQIPVDLDGYSRGDRHGLALLGGTRRIPHACLPAPGPAPERTIPCS